MDFVRSSPPHTLNNKSAHHLALGLLSLDLRLHFAEPARWLAWSSKACRLCHGKIQCSQLYLHSPFVFAVSLCSPGSLSFCWIIFFCQQILFWVESAYLGSAYFSPAVGGRSFACPVSFQQKPHHDPSQFRCLMLVSFYWGPIKTNFHVFRSHKIAKSASRSKSREKVRPLDKSQYLKEISEKK